MAAEQAALLAFALVGLGVVIWVGARVARPWMWTRDEQRHVARSQMSLLRMADAPFRISDGFLDADALPGRDDLPRAGPAQDARDLIMSSPVARTRPLNWVNSPAKAIGNWNLWDLPWVAVGWLVTVEAGAVAATVALNFGHPADRSRLEFFAAITTLGVAAAESTRSVERMRRWFSDTPHVNMSSVWTLAAALLTTPALAAATSVILYGHLWWRSWYRVSGVQPYRVLFNVSTVILSCQVAGLIARATPGGLSPAPRTIHDLVGVFLVVAAYSAVNSALAAGALALLRDQRSVRGLLGSWQENSIEYATLSVGVVATAALAWRPFLVLLLLLPLYVLHRSVLIRQLEHAATVDEQTGLLNTETWHSLATTELRRARQRGSPVGVLLADLDHFAEVNDRFGYPTGDEALLVVADVLRQEIRFGDLCGRHGGEEFAILLLDTDLAKTVEVAERMCARIRSLRIHGDAGDPELWLSVSIGAAVFPNAGGELDDVLLAADNALFAAKDAGRDQARAVQLGSI